MQNGRDHQEREEKFATRLEQQARRDEEPVEAEIAELDRRGRAPDPAPTEKAAAAERARHAKQQP